VHLPDEIEALRARLRAAEDLLRIAPAFFGFLDVEGAILDLNQRALDAIGAERDRVLGMRFWEAPWWSPVPESAARVQDAVDAAAAGQATRFDVPYWVVASGGAGQIRWVTLELSPVLDAAGAVTRISATGLDITDRIEAGHELDLALASAQMGTWHVDLATQRVTSSARMAAIFGVPAVNENVFELTARVLHPDDRDELTRAWLDSVARRAPFYHEFRIVRPDGAVRWLFSRGTTKLDTLGEPLFFSGVVGDITERKEAEAARDAERHKLAEVFRQAPAAMVLWRGPDFVFDLVNPGYQAIFPGRELLGKPLLEALPELADQPFPQLLRQVLETGEPFHGREVLARLVLRPGGPLEDRYYDFTYFRIADGDGRAYGIWDHAVDVTDRVLARRALESSVRDLERERELRDRFVEALTHDLRTPLTAAKMSANLLSRRDGGPAETQRIAGRIADHMDRADRMIRDLLDASRIKAGEKVAVTITDCDFAEVARTTLEDLASIHGDRFLLDAPSILAGPCDASALRRIVENLATNAVKYGASGGPVAVRLDRSGAMVELTVHNDGPPIATADQPRLFGLFQRGEAAVRSSQKGWGIGLTLVHGLARALGGECWVRSIEGDGTTFGVRLPLAPATSAGGGAGAPISA
jgi:PAS domain S-box-containing protein